MFLSKLIIYTLYIVSGAALGIVLLYARKIDGIPDPGTQTALLVFALLCFAFALKNVWNIVKFALLQRKSKQGSHKGDHDGKSFF